MLGMHDQAGVHDAYRQRIGFHPGKHVHKVFCMRQVMARFDRIITIAHMFPGSNNGGHSGDDFYRHAVHVVQVFASIAFSQHTVITVEHTKTGHGGLQHFHGMTGSRQVAHDFANVVLDLALSAKLLVEIVELGFCR